MEVTSQTITAIVSGAVFLSVVALAWAARTYLNPERTARDRIAELTGARRAQADSILHQETTQGITTNIGALAKPKDKEEANQIRRRLIQAGFRSSANLEVFSFARAGLALGLPVLLAWPVAHLALGLSLMAEHTGLPNAGSQLERTRTVRSNGLVRWFMWNMPYHAEHHTHAGVPFHAVPRLHGRLEPDLVNVATGHLAFHREALRRCLQ